MNKRFSWIMTAGVLAAALTLAQNPTPPPPGAEQPEGDPPGRAARVSFLQGNISLNPAGVEEWVPANLNRPLTTGDKLWVEADARAEVHLGTLAVRIGGNTSFGIVNLDDQTAQMQVNAGSVCIRIRRLAEGETVEVDTPQLAFALTRPGEYRIDVSEADGSTSVTVRAGEGEITAGGQAFPVLARQQVRVAGGEQPTFDKRDAPPMDALDNFCMERDRREDRSTSIRYVSRDIPGYADLDEFGDWRPHPTYGSVWFPRAVAADWAPYRQGHFSWVGGWGYTWVGEEPWGYAPYHYGRWSHLNGRWGWIPGPIVERPVYAPALVSWVGGDGFGAELAVGGGAVGWFPLGPGEVWVPSWRASSGYFTRVNRSGTIFSSSVRLGGIYDTVIVRNGAYRPVYANHFVGGAVSACRVTDFGNGRAVRECGIRVTPGALRRGEFVRTAYVVPSRGAVFGYGRLGGGRQPPRVIVERTIVVRRNPPRVVPFDRQQGSFRNNPGRPVDSRTMNGLRGGLPPDRGGYRPVGQGIRQPGGQGQGGMRPPGGQGQGQGGMRPPGGQGQGQGGMRPPGGQGGQGQGGMRPPGGQGQGQGGVRPPGSGGQGTGQGGVRPPGGQGTGQGGVRPPGGQGTGQGGVRPPGGQGSGQGGVRPPGGQGTGQGGVRPPGGQGTGQGGVRPPGGQGTGQGGVRPPGSGGQGTGQGGVRPPGGQGTGQGGVRPPGGQGAGQGGVRPPGGQGTGQGGMRPPGSGGQGTGQGGVRPPGSGGQGTGQGGVRPPGGQGTGQGGVRPPGGQGAGQGGVRPPGGQGTGQGGMRPPGSGGQGTGQGGVRPPGSGGQGTGQGGVRPPGGQGTGQGGVRPPGGQGAGQGTGVRTPQGGPGGQPGGGVRPPQGGMPGGRPTQPAVTGGQPGGGVRTPQSNMPGGRPTQPGGQPGVGVRSPQGGMPGGRPVQPPPQSPGGMSGGRRDGMPGGRPAQPPPQVRQPTPQTQQPPQVRQQPTRQMPQTQQPAPQVRQQPQRQMPQTQQPAPQVRQQPPRQMPQAQQPPTGGTPQRGPGAPRGNRTDKEKKQ